MSDTPDAIGSASPASGHRGAAIDETAAQVDVTSPSAPHAARQRVVRVGGGRRARLLPAPGTSAEPAPSDARPQDVRSSEPAASGPNDAQLLRDVPPHY